MGVIRVFEAFSGIGTQRMALRNLGIEHEVVGISEIDKFAIKSYEAIHGETVNFGDISKLNPKDLPDFDLFTYSFPCQDLSIAGQCAGMIKGQTRSGLLYECEKIIEAKRPKYLLLENVKNLVGKKFKPQFDEWLTYLETLGYTNYWQVLNAKDYGIPQNRERVFVVSVLGEHDGYAFPKKQNLNIRLKDVLESQVKEKYYLSEKIQARFRPNENFKNMNSNIVGTTAPSFRTIGQHDLCYHENSIMGALMAVDYKQPKQLVERIGGCFECECKYAIEEPKAYKIRKLTPLECWRLMGISDEDFYKAEQFNSDSQLYKQAGNGIVVPVLEGIFKELFK